MFYSAVARYLRRPTFRHAIDAVPFILYGPSTARRWARVGGVHVGDKSFVSLCWSLKRWKAFLGAGYRSHAQMKGRLAKVLPRALGQVLAATGGEPTSIADAEEEVWTTVVQAAHTISWQVKSSRSPVLGSKVLHLLLPSLVPAYDNVVIRVKVLPKLSARGRSFSNYLDACRLAMRELAAAPRRHGLERARRVVWQHLRAAYLEQIQDATESEGPWVVQPPAGPPQSCLVDSYVAEYALIGLAREPSHRSRRMFAEAGEVLEAE